MRERSPYAIGAVIGILVVAVALLIEFNQKPTAWIMCECGTVTYSKLVIDDIGTPNSIKCGKCSGRWIVVYDDFDKRYEASVNKYKDGYWVEIDGKPHNKHFDEIGGYIGKER